MPSFTIVLVIFKVTTMLCGALFWPDKPVWVEHLLSSNNLKKKINAASIEISPVSYTAKSTIHFKVVINSIVYELLLYLI